MRNDSDWSAGQIIVMMTTHFRILPTAANNSVFTLMLVKNWNTKCFVDYFLHVHSCSTFIVSFDCV